MNKPIIALVTAGLLATALETGAGAQTWTKTGNPGNLPSTAQITTGVGALTTITGSLSYTGLSTSNRSNPDLFAIYITGTGLFSATTVGQPTNLFDPRLFLFDSNGLGVFYNDDASPGTAQSTIAPTTSLAPGEYFLGIGVQGVVPRNAVPVTGPPAVPTTSASDIFPTIDDFPGTTGFTGLYGPTGPGGAKPLLSWSLSSQDVETGFYTIALNGATFAAAPEPSAWITLGVGLLSVGGLAVRARRRGAIS